MLPNRTRKKVSWIGFSAVLLLAGFALGLYLHNIFRWAGSPDFGYSFRTATGIHIVGVVTEHGSATGLRMGDRILKINGKTYSTYSELNKIRNWGADEENAYLLERDGSKLLIKISNTRLGFGKSFQKSGLPFVFGLCYLAIGVLVFLMKPHHRTSWVFFIFATVVGTWMATLFKTSFIKPDFLENAIVFAYAFVPATIIHLALNFPEERSVVREHPSIQWLPYGVSGVIFTAIRLSTSTMSDAPKLWVNAAVIYLAVSLLFLLGSCLQLRLVSISQITKLRARVILLGFGIACSVPLADFFINALFETYLLTGFNFYLPFFIVVPLAIGYSIVKHDLFDIDTIIKRTYGYILTTAGIAGVYALFVFVSNLAFGRFEITKSPMFPLIFILAVVFFFNPVRNRIQKVIDRVFYRLDYDYQATVQKISETMRRLLGLDEIGKSIMSMALGTMFIDAGSLLLLDKEEKRYAPLIYAGRREMRGCGEEGSEGSRDVVEMGETSAETESAVSPAQSLDASTEVSMRERDAQGPILDGKDPFIQKMAERKREATIFDVQEDPFFEDQRERCEKTLRELNATLVVPLIYEKDLIGLMALGEKKSGKLYRREDINLLTILANQGAVAIENAWMVEDVVEKERMEEELSIARDLQISMLPAACPQIEGFQIAAVSIPAREVGGDFYDFIEMGEGKLGFVIGDVTGKSVSGALVMAASRSIFRMLSEERLGVGEIMIRANRRTKQDIKPGMFVALLYAVVDSKEKALKMCSAGQTQPVHFSSQTGGARLLETEGDTFPLGILDEAEYKETQLQLNHGDRVVFYTDGIVEAMNKEQEIFGFERLLDLIKGAGLLEAQALLKEIMRQVNEFVGGAPQSDDLTVIVVSVDGRE